jgi:hypothetical protein
MPRHAQPVGPGSILPGLIDQALTDVEHHRTDHAHYPMVDHCRDRRFAALAIRFIEDRTGWSINKFVRTARRYRIIHG